MRQGADRWQTGPEATDQPAHDSTKAFVDCLALQMYNDTALPGYIVAACRERDCRQTSLQRSDRYEEVSIQD